MFYYLNGVISIADHQLVVVDCGGVGYAVSTSNATIARLKSGETGRLYTYVHVREDILDIYGFCDLSELNCFKMLIGISGVGPKAALSILSSATPEQVALAVISEDEKTLTMAAGVGKKLAQRIILELKDKLSKEKLTFSVDTEISLPQASAPAASEAVAALIVLGYSRSEAVSALKGLETDGMPVQEIIRQSLKKMVKPGDSR